MADPSMAELLSDVASGVGEWEDRAWFPPGPQLAICLSGGKNRLADLSDAELTEMAAAAHRQAAWAQARELAAIAELTHRRTRAEEGGDLDYRVLSAHESVVEEVATALTVTGNTAATLVHLADRLATVLPGTHQALEAGRIDLAKARVISDLTDTLPDEVAGRAEDAVLDRATIQTTGQLRRSLKRAVQRLAPQEAEERREAARRARALLVCDTPDGTADLAVTHLDPGDARAIHNKISAAARSLKTDGDVRSMDQIRADLATQLLRGASLPEALRHLLTHPESGVGQGEPADPQAADAARSAEPSPHGAPLRDEDTTLTALASLVRHRLTAVTEHARASGRLDGLAAHVTRAVLDMQRQLSGIRHHLCHTAPPHPDHQVDETNPTCQADHNDRADHGDEVGEVHGHPGYRPPAALRRLVQARHATCVFPTCNRPSRLCDLDHTVPYGRGATCAGNLAPLCRRHHRTKQSPGWTLFQLWPGLIVWITPSGKWHIVLPQRQ